MTINIYHVFEENKMILDFPLKYKIYFWWSYIFKEDISSLKVYLLQKYEFFKKYFFENVFSKCIWLNIFLNKLYFQKCFNFENTFLKTIFIWKDVYQKIMIKNIIFYNFNWKY